MITKTAVSNVAIKSFQSLAVSEDLLSKVVEAVTMGEKEAKSSGEIKSFELFQTGFRQNIAIGNLYLIPAKVCNDKGNFPVSLLYGTIVRTFNLGEEMADMISHKCGESEFDSEYSQVDFQTLKDALFLDKEDDEYKSLILFAPHWSNIREYIGFQYTSDEGKLKNLLRHLIFSAYYNPAVATAFDALINDVDTSKFDITDISPKLSYPFLSENPLRAFPELVKQAGWAKKKVFLTKKAAEAIFKEILDPAELNVFEALDAALSEVVLPETTSMEEVADFQAPDAGNGFPDVEQVKDSIETAKEATEKAKTATTITQDFATPEEFLKALNQARRGKKDWIYYQGNVAGHSVSLKTYGNSYLQIYRVDDKSQRLPPMDCNVGTWIKAILAPFEGLSQAKEAACKHKASMVLDADGNRTCVLCETKLNRNGEAIEDGFKAKPDYGKEASAPFESPFTNVGPGTAAHEESDHAITVKVDSPSREDEEPLGIELDKTGLPVREKVAGTWLDDLKKSDPKLYEAYKLTGNQDSTSLRNMVRALSSPISSFLNTPEDEARLEAAKYILRNLNKSKGKSPRTASGKVAGLSWNIEYNEHKKCYQWSVLKSSLIGSAKVVASGEEPSKERANTAVQDKIREISSNGQTPRGTLTHMSSQAEIIASAITEDIGDDYDASSTTTKAARKKNEDHLDKYSSRRKMAEVDLTFDNIWDDITEDFGAAPMVDVTGEGSPAKSESSPSPKKEESTEDSPKAEKAPDESKKEGFKSKLLTTEKKADFTPTNESAIEDAKRSEIWKKEFMDSLQIGRSRENARARADEADRSEKTKVALQNTPSFLIELRELNEDTKKYEWVSVGKEYENKKDAEKALSRILDKEPFDTKGRVVTAGKVSSAPFTPHYSPEFPKIDIFENGEYKYSTKWYPSIKEYQKANPQVNKTGTGVTAQYDTRDQSRKAASTKTATYAEDGICPNCGNESVEWDEDLNEPLCTHCGWVESDEIAQPEGFDEEPTPLPPSPFCECESNFCPHGEIRCQNPPQEKVRIFGYGTTLCEPCRKMHEQESPGEVEILSKFACDGAEYDESVEMSDSFGDLADLAANLPHPDKHEE